MSHFLCSLPPSLLLFPFFFFFFLSMAAQSNITYPNCPSYDCDGVKISYPFWRIDNQSTTPLCGYQGFGINCSSINGQAQDHPIIDLGGDCYYVRNIAYETPSIILVDYDASDIFPNPNDCPRVRHEIDWQQLPFNFSSYNVNLSFHFNCTGVPDFASEIQCMKLPTRKSCVNYMSDEPEHFDWGSYSCDDEVVTWVSDVTRSERLGRDFGRDLSRGFELTWGRLEACEKCEESDGRCGYNNNTTEFMCFCSDGRTTTGHCNKGSKIDWKLKLLIGGLVSALLSMLLIFIIYCNMKSSWSNCVATFKHKTDDDKSVVAFVKQYGSLSTKRYKYVDIKKMTNSFQVKLGQGGFGTVFKGKLLDGRLVAVKVLNSSKASGQEFINEVASIGRTSHVNIVTLLGFCFDYKKRALIYEFMPNGSLEKFIHGHVPLKTSEHIGVDKMYEVALGIARGLDYLHRGCNTRILHLDIKPHNILLDEDFCPKIADFGLAKLYSRKKSIVSILEARGTIGYIAPEVFNRNFGGVSHKSDVYSYGMLILEMIGGRKNIDGGVGSGHSSETYFPDWIYKRLKKDEFQFDGAITIEENDYARKMTIVGLWCIQTNPMQRPSIDEVIEMLEGSMEALEVPPKPFFSSPDPRSTITSFNTSQEVSQDHPGSTNT